MDIGAVFWPLFYFSHFWEKAIMKEDTNRTRIQKKFRKSEKGKLGREGTEIQELKGDRRTGNNKGSRGKGNDYGKSAKSN